MLKRIALYASISSVIAVSALYYVDRVYLSSGSSEVKSVSSNAVSKKQDYSTKDTTHKVIKTRVPVSAKKMSVDKDGKYVAYLSSNSLYIKKFSGDETLKTIKQDETILDYKFGKESDSIIYLTYNQSVLTVNVYDIKKDSVVRKSSVGIKNLVAVSNMQQLSSGDIFFHVKLKQGDKTASNVYIAKKSNPKEVVPMMINKNIEKIFMMDSENYTYEDSDGYLHINKAKFKIKGQDVKLSLLGVDSSDNVYVLTDKEPKQIYVINNGKITKVTDLMISAKGSPLSFNGKTYLNYSDLLYDIAGNNKIYKPVGKDIIGIVGTKAVVIDKYTEEIELSDK